MRKSIMSSLRWAGAALALVFAGAVQAQTVYSDNFQSYNPTVQPAAFSSTYTFVANNVINGMNPANVYSVTSDLSANLGSGQTQHPTIGANGTTGNPGFFDHTFGNASGLYLAINGGAASSVYRANSIAVTPNTDYVFSVWLNSWTNAGNPTFGRIEVQFLGNASNVTGQFVNAPPVGGYNTWGQAWTLATVNFNSGTNTTIDLNLINAETAADGNDYSIDDISLSVLATVPEPASIALAGLGFVGLSAAVVSKVNSRRRRKAAKKVEATA
jgi:hypothetical protein